MATTNERKMNSYLRCCFLTTMTMVAAGRVDLPLGDINVVVVTDVHSWVAGHGAHESLDADFGDVLSFYERLNSSDYDTWFVMNGDFIDGTGLSTYPPVNLEPILMKMPWDAVNVGNHDIYKNETVEFITRPGGLVDWFGERYLTSNVIHAYTGTPIGQRYRYLRGKHATVLTFGFLYNLVDDVVGSPLTRVEPVEEVVRNEWFLNVLARSHDYDAILVLAHMGVEDSAITIILTAIRKATTPTMPVQFITGHTHYRRYDVLDDWSTAFEAGCYLNTVGFVSFPTKRKTAAENVTSGNLFHHEFLDAKVKTLQKRLGVPKLKTENGQALTDFILKTQQSMGLSRVVGCSPRTFYMNKTLFDEDSLFGLWANKVIRTQFLSQNARRVVLQGTSSSFRYDLFEGNVTMDDLMIVSPFNDTMYLIASDLTAATIIELNRTMNQKRRMDLSGLPDFILIGNLMEGEQSYDLYTLEYEVPFIQRALETISGKQLEPKPVDAAATSLWLSFFENYWQTCELHGSIIGETKLTKKMDGIQPADMIIEKGTRTRPLVFPGVLAVVVAIASATSAFLLLIAFVLRRIPKRKQSDDAEKLI
jgi:2',3'-cyclic-nucleotide 2'-phosphodiesterase (5'-nucleotidase family)